MLICARLKRISHLFRIVRNFEILLWNIRKSISIGIWIEKKEKKTLGGGGAYGEFHQMAEWFEQISIEIIRYRESGDAKRIRPQKIQQTTIQRQLFTEIPYSDSFQTKSKRLPVDINRMKRRKCPFCIAAFTFSCLIKHLDQNKLIILLVQIVIEIYIILYD